MKAHKPSVISLFINEVGYSGIREIMRGLPKFLSLFRSSAFRRYVKEAWPSMNVFKGYKYTWDMEYTSEENGLIS